MQVFASEHHHGHARWPRSSRRACNRPSSIPVAPMPSATPFAPMFDSNSWNPTTGEPTRSRRSTTPDWSTSSPVHGPSTSSVTRVRTTWSRTCSPCPGSSTGSARSRPAHSSTTNWAAGASRRPHRSPREPSTPHGRRSTSRSARPRRCWRGSAAPTGCVVLRAIMRRRRSTAATASSTTPRSRPITLRRPPVRR
jgi:hypothetical protein